MRWTVIEGNFEIRGAQIVFKGSEAQYMDNQGRQQTGNAVGLAMTTSVSPEAKSARP